MNYNYRGEYNVKFMYHPRDVVSFKTNNVTRYYFCLKEVSGSQPTPNIDTDTWANINTLSDFPNSVDTFITKKNLQASDKSLVMRYQELSLLTNPTTAQQSEMSSLLDTLRDKLITSEDINKLQQSISNLQMFMKTNVEGYINQKVSEMDSIKQSFQNEVTTKTNQVTNTMTESVSTMDSKKTHFENYVNTKEDEIRGMVQDFDSRSTRYYQNWTASNGQMVYNIFNGNIQNIPTEARLMLESKDLDVIIQGTLLTPEVDYKIVQNNNYDSIELLVNPSLITAGTEVIAKWYKNVGKLYFKHSTTHEFGSTDAIMNIREEQLYAELKSKINSGGIRVSAQQPTNGVWFKLV